MSMSIYSITGVSAYLVALLLLVCVGSEAKFSIRTQSVFSSFTSNSTSFPDQTGDSIYLFHQGFTNSLYHVNYLHGNLWQNDVYISTSPVYYGPSAAVFNNGAQNNIYVFYRDSGGSLYVFNQATLIEQTLTSNNVIGSPVAVVFGRTLYAFYMITGQTQYQYLSSTDGIVWSSSPSAVPRLPGGCAFIGQPGVVVDTSFNNVLWLWYIDGTGGLNYITFDGTQWSSWIALPSTFSPGAQNVPAAVAYMGSVYIYFNDGSQLCYVQQTSATDFLAAVCVDERIASVSNQIAGLSYTGTAVYIFWQCGSDNTHYCYTFCSDCNNPGDYKGSNEISTIPRGSWQPSGVVY